MAIATKTPSHAHETLEDCIRARHSVRIYDDRAVPEEDLIEALSLARLAPSNSNMQNWRLHLASHAAKTRIVADLFETAQKQGPNIPPLPEQFKHFRSDVGHELYGPHGYNIARSDTAAHNAAQMRNYTFFDAPVIGVISMHHDLAQVEAMSVGMFVQTLMLMLTERGLGTCLQVSVTGYPDVLRRGFQIGEDQLILCGICIGYPAKDAPVNNVHIARDRLGEQVTLLRE